MPDITKVQLGACTVTFNNVDLGHTQGGAEVSYEPEWTEVMVDKYGKTPIDSYLTGERLTVKIPLAEYTVANLKVAMPTGTFAGAGNARMTLGNVASIKASTLAAQLVLHPINQGTRQHDIVLHKAFVSDTVTLPHKVDEQKIVEVTFTALLDETKSAGNYLGLIGDSTA
jgi:hypothetical protein